MIVMIENLSTGATAVCDTPSDLWAKLLRVAEDGCTGVQCQLRFTVHGKACDDHEWPAPHGWRPRGHSCAVKRL